MVLRPRRTFTGGASIERGTHVPVKKGMPVCGAVAGAAPAWTRCMFRVNASSASALAKSRAPQLKDSVPAAARI
jgi:hypothetical protein